MISITTIRKSVHPRLKSYVHTIDLKELNDETIRVGDEVLIDGIQKKIIGIELTTPHIPSQIGLLVEDVK